MLQLQLAPLAVLCASLLSCGGAAAAAKKPHLVIVLTDDQDMTLGSLAKMPKLKRLVADEGVFFTNGFIRRGRRLHSALHDFMYYLLPFGY
jgi:hypothetical protein